MPLSDADDGQSVNSMYRLDATKLSYSEMTVDPTGSVMSRAAKQASRIQLGYCPTCPDRPVLLFDLQKGRLKKVSALWQKKQPRSVAGECEAGVCLKCRKEEQQQQQQQQQQQRTRAAARMVVGSSTGRQVSSTSTLTQASSSEPFLHPTRSTTHSSAHSSSLDSLPRMGAAAGVTTTTAMTTARIERWGRHSMREPPNALPRRSLSSEELPLTTARTTHHGGSPATRAGMLTPHHSSRGPTAATMSSSSHHRAAGLRLARSDRPALLPRREQSAEQDPPYAARSLRDPMVSRHISTSDISVASTLSNDSLIPSLDDEGLPGRYAAAAATTSSRMVARPSFRAHPPIQSPDQAVMDQLRILIRDLRDNPIMLAEILLHAMKSNATTETIQTFCLQHMGELPLSAVSQSGLHRGTLQAMKNHRSSLPIQQASLGLLTQWCDDADLRHTVTQAGLCEHLPPALTLHMGDAGVVQEVTALLRLVTLEAEARIQCQRLDMAQLLVQAMPCHATASRIQTDGCAVLSNLALDADEKTVHILPPAVLEAVVTALLTQVQHPAHATEWPVVKSACFSLKNFLYRSENQRALAQRDDLLQGLETLVHRGRRKSKDAVGVLEKLQMARAQDESLQAQLMEALQLLWYKSATDAVDEILQVWQDHAWSATILVASLHMLQDLLQGQPPTMAQQVSLVESMGKLAQHSDTRVVQEVDRLRMILSEL